ncbi:peptidoglycan DD-metalloendopeptidase family protein [Heyndrickxia sp. NPDC080065]|uniref:peptidoglycan DD-metalloendopeptidase family protein n=1 Tax=Heyndrickxia sp. NPDC080065 TaxID=3390568 RepID=UPI003D047DBC
MREEEKKLTSRKKGNKSFFKKRWVYPAIYLASAALIITAIFWYQSIGNNSAKNNFGYQGDKLGENGYKNPAVEANKSVEDFKWPVKNYEQAQIDKEFYDSNASEEKQEAAMIVYGSTYEPNRGIDITMKDGKEFEVIAALSGTILKVENDALLGNTIDIQHENGVVTQYQSIKDVKVKVGDKVKQGQAIATASTSQLSEKGKTHLHFEIRKDNVAVNPVTYFDKPSSSIEVMKDDKANKQNQDKSNDASDDGKSNESNSEKNTNDKSNTNEDSQG